MHKVWHQLVVQTSRARIEVGADLAAQDGDGAAGVALDAHVPQRPRHTTLQQQAD